MIKKVFHRIVVICCLLSCFVWLWYGILLMRKCFAMLLMKAWADILFNNNSRDSDVNSTTQNATEFVRECLQPTGVASGRYISYNSSSQQELVPNIVTLAGVMDAVLIDVNTPLSQWPTDNVESTAEEIDFHSILQGLGIPAMTAPVFDAVTEFAGYTPFEATSFIYEHYVNETKGVSKVRISKLSSMIIKQF